MNESRKECSESQEAWTLTERTFFLKTIVKKLHSLVKNMIRLRKLVKSDATVII